MHLKYARIFGTFCTSKMIKSTFTRNQAIFCNTYAWLRSNGFHRKIIITLSFRGNCFLQGWKLRWKVDVKILQDKKKYISRRQEIFRYIKFLRKCSWIVFQAKSFIWDIYIKKENIIVSKVLYVKKYFLFHFLKQQ